MLINSTMLHISFQNPFTGEDNCVISFDSGINSREYKRLRTCTEYMTKLLKKCGNNDLEDVSQFLYNYVMNGGTRYFLDYMRPIYMSREFLERIRLNFFHDEHADNFAFRYSTICANIQKSDCLQLSPSKLYLFREHCSAWQCNYPLG